MTAPAVSPATIRFCNASTTSSTGTIDNWWYSLYIEEDTGATLEIDEAGSYSLTWEESATDVVAGIGWSTGSAQ